MRIFRNLKLVVPRKTQKKTIMRFTCLVKVLKELLILLKKQCQNPLEKEIRKELKSEEQGSFVSSSSSASLCMDRLREELSCAICLEICYEPSTTSCGHSFCEKCLRSAADICGTRCPKCRQLIRPLEYNSTTVS